MRTLCLGKVVLSVSGDPVSVRIRYGAARHDVLVPRSQSPALFVAVRSEDGEAAVALLKSLQLGILHDSQAADAVDSTEPQQPKTQAETRFLTLQTKDVERDFWRVIVACDAADWIVSLNWLPPPTHAES